MAEKKTTSKEKVVTIKIGEEHLTIISSILMGYAYELVNTLNGDETFKKMREDESVTIDQLTDQQRKMLYTITEVEKIIDVLNKNVKSR